MPEPALALAPFAIPCGSTLTWSAKPAWKERLLALISQLPKEDANAVFRRKGELSTEGQTTKKRMLSQLTTQLFVVVPEEGARDEAKVDEERQKLIKKVGDQVGRCVALM